MLLVYPAIFHKEDGAFWVEFPDLDGCHTYGETLPETLKCAQEAMGLYLNELLEAKKPLPKPTGLSEIKCDKNAFANLVSCDIDAYIQGSKAVKKTLTIPGWLNELAVQNNINFSRALQEVLLERLHIVNK